MTLKDFKLRLGLILFHVMAFNSSFGQLPAVNVKLTQQSTGFYFLTPGSPSSSYHFILDSVGEFVYYKKWPAKTKTSDFKLQLNGLISYHLNEGIYMMDSTFRVVDSVTTKNNVKFDNHDFHILRTGNYVLLGFENVKMDLSSYNYFNKNGSPGSNSAVVKCSVIQELDPNKNLIFQWNSKDHYNLENIDTSRISDPLRVDCAHINAVEFDTDGNMLVSARNFNEITKINKKDGSVMWRFGGIGNQFKFIGDQQMFAGQHDIRRLRNGNITLFDNGDPYLPKHPCRALEYTLNEKTLTATSVWTYVNDSLAYSIATGNVQRLQNGNTLIHYGITKNSPTLFSVVNSSRVKIFDFAFNDSLRSYRVFNYPNLPWGLKRPEIKRLNQQDHIYLDAGKGYASYHWSTGEKTQTIEVKKPGRYQVFVPIGDGGFISSPCIIIDQKQLLNQTKK